MKMIRLIELFAGYGSQALALKRLGVPFVNYRAIDFDIYAMRSYNAIHGTNFDSKDINDISADDLGLEPNDNFSYLMTYSFPCTDLSKAGSCLGMKKGEGTRSGLLWQVERLLTEARDSDNLVLPDFLLMENAIQVHGEQNIADFGEWITFLDSLGYVSKWQDLDAKSYGVPQTRLRCFLVSYLDKSIKFAFPSPVELKKSVQDYLEPNVSEDFYISKDRAQIVADELIESEDADGHLIIKANNGEGSYSLDLSGVCDLSFPYSKTRRARVQNNGNICPTISTCYRLDKIDKVSADDKQKLGVIEKAGNYYRIRKLTPLECLKLMDLTEDEAKNILAVNTDSQAYKQAGNSIVVSVMSAIFNNLLLGGSQKEKAQIDIFDILD